MTTTRVEPQRVVITAKTPPPIQTVRDGLCVRCGACRALCPDNKIELDDRAYPSLVSQTKGCSGCGICTSVCPGRDMDLPGLHRSLFEHPFDPTDILGHVDRACLGHSTDQPIRIGGSAGGVVTQVLISLMREGVIKKALVAGSSSSQPWRGVPVLANTPMEVMACAQSKYTVLPQMAGLAEALSSGEDVAIVGLPCHIQAFRKYQAKYPERTSQVKLVVGLFCHMTLEIEATLRILDIAKVAPEDVERIEYRSGRWPGRMVAYLKSGEARALHPHDFRSAINYLKRLYFPQRCLLCVDYSSQLSDLSVGDAWRPHGRRTSDWALGQSVVLSRTPNGSLALQIAEQSGDIALEGLDAESFRSGFDGHRRHKRAGLAIRIKAGRKRGLPCPEYHMEWPAIGLQESILEASHKLCRSLGCSSLGRRVGSRLAFSILGRGLAQVLEWRKR